MIANGQTPRLILVVDDEPAVGEVLRSVLEAEGHQVVLAFDGRSSMAGMAARRPDLVILDIDLPQTGGLEICRRLKSSRDTRLIPILVLTGMAVGERMHAWELGADEFLTKPFHCEEIAARCRSLLRHKDLVDALDSAESVVFTLVRTIEAKSAYTHGHSGRVTSYALSLAERLGLGETEIDILRRGAALHDIGKISTPDTILNKPGKLTPEELEVIQRHPAEGARIVDSLRSAQDVIPLIRWHHERMDGKGYPDGLMGGAIPLVVRVLAVADTYDALASTRPYRPAMSHKRSAEVMVEVAAAGGLDPELVQLFFDTVLGSTITAGFEQSYGAALIGKAI